jgi:hypothetical protein
VNAVILRPLPFREPDRRPGHPGRMEQFPCHGVRLRTGFL